MAAPSGPDSEVENGYLLGGLLIALLAVLVAAVVVLSPRFPPDPADGLTNILTGVYLIAWGLMFLASYYFSHKTFFFRGLIWVCENWSNPRGRRMAFFYFGVACLAGVMAILMGLGLLESRHS